MTVQAAHAFGGIAATAFSRIRNADLERFMVDRLIRIINHLAWGTQWHGNVDSIQARFIPTHEGEHMLSRRKCAKEWVSFTPRSVIASLLST
ncbi:MAG: hypothetical protein ABI167_06205 [Nitrosospira sp.]